MAGNVAGEYVLLVSVLMGVGALVPTGLQAVLHQRSPIDASHARGPAEDGAPHRPGVGLVGVSNPRANILFAAILPQFVDRPAGQVPVPLLLEANGGAGGLRMVGIGVRPALSGRNGLSEQATRLTAVRAATATARSLSSLPISRDSSSAAAAPPRSGSEDRDASSANPPR
jgi:hypothetical protein